MGGKDGAHGNYFSLMHLQPLTFLVYENLFRSYGWLPCSFVVYE